MFSRSLAGNLKIGAGRGIRNPTFGLEGERAKPLTLYLHCEYASALVFSAHTFTEPSGMCPRLGGESLITLYLIKDALSTRPGRNFLGISTQQLLPRGLSSSRQVRQSTVS